MVIRSFLIEEKGRKYYKGKLWGKYPAQIVINDESRDLTIGNYAEFEANDISTQGTFGKKLKFEPIKLLSELKPAHYKSDSETYINLNKARTSISNGNFNTKEITFLRNEAKYAHTDRLKTELKSFWAERAEAMSAHDEAAIARQNEIKEQSKAPKIENETAVISAPAPAPAQMRRLYPVHNQPPLNVPVRSGDDIIVFTGSGKSFRISDEAPSMHGSQLSGYEGQQGSYVYYRAATDKEITSLIDQEALVAAQKAGYARLTDIANEIKAGELPDSVDGQITGDFIKVGNFDKVSISKDFIWHLHDTGVDNAGNYGDTVVHKIPFSQDLATEMLDIANKLNIAVDTVADERVELMPVKDKNVIDQSENSRTTKTLQTISPDQRQEYNYILKIINSETSSEREYDRYETKDELDQAIEELKNDGSLSENEEIETEYVGPDVIIENLWISKQDGTGDLIITAEFQTFDSDGEETFNGSSDEYVDVDTGQIDIYSHGLMRSETQWGYFDVNKVHEAINDALYETPIGDSILDDARERADLRDRFDECQLNSESDKIAVVNTDIFASDDGVMVSFNLIEKYQSDKADYSSYVESSILYAHYDSESETFKFNEKYDAEISPLSEEIRNQLQEFRELPETQIAIEKATAEHLEKKTIQDIKNSIQNGEAEIIKFNVVEDNYKLATQATIIAKDDDRIFDVQAINQVDLETGKSLNTDDYRSYPFSSDMNDMINSKINEYLQENPISEYEIERYKEDTANQKYLAAEFHSGQSDRNSNVAVSNLHIAINADKEVIANFDVIERKSTSYINDDYRYTEHVMMSEKVDLDTKSVVHKSQSSLDYSSYDHDEVRSAVSKKIQSDGLLSDRAVASIKNKIGALSEEKDEDRQRMVAR